MTRILASVLGFLALAAPCVPAVPLPPPLETSHLLAKPLSDEFYALGWGKSGTLAVLERRSLGPGRIEVRFRIYDLVEDRILEERTWEDWGEPANRDPWWEARSAEADSLFTRYQIVPGATQLGVFPLIFNNNFYQLVLRSNRSPADPGWVNRLEAVVRSSGRGMKTVLDLPGYWRWAGVLGFLPSPFEDRVALVLAVQPAGWAGSRAPIRFLVTGMSLTAGFPAP